MATPTGSPREPLEPRCTATEVRDLAPVSWTSESRCGRVTESRGAIGGGASMTWLAGSLHLTMTLGWSHGVVLRALRASTTLGPHSKPVLVRCGEADPVAHHVHLSHTTAR